MNNIINVNNISYEYITEESTFKAIDNLNLDVKQGEFVAIIGHNGSGKSTILNIIAHKLNLKGKERNNPEVIGTVSYFEDFANDCTYELGENENSRKIYRLPENSRYIKSEEILYEIRKIQQEALLIFSKSITSKKCD